MEELENAGQLLSQLENDTEKRVRGPRDIDTWQRTRAYHDLFGYINGTSEAIQGIRLTDEIYVSDIIKRLCEVFDALEVIVEKNAPLEQPQRFGNKAYRGFARQMHRDIFLMLEQALPKEKCQYLNEIGQYISQSFGNSTRIDYGTGHELSFVFFLCALFKAKILDEKDTVAAALVLFNRYLNFVRCLQQTYNMEPAGSQGVWSLDDYQFLPFIWGSAQLSFKAPFDPSQFIEDNIRMQYKQDYMFIGAIDYICKVKTGHFGEHSPQLWSITAVSSWAKINAGLVRMYQREVLSKYPIMQHVYFGELMRYETVPLGTPLPSPQLGSAAVKRVHDSSTMPPPATPGPLQTKPKTVSISKERPLYTIGASSSSSEKSDVTSTSSSEGIRTRPRSDSQATILITDQSSVYYPLPRKSMAAADITAHTVTPNSDQSHLQMAAASPEHLAQPSKQLLFNEQVTTDNQYKPQSENPSEL